MAINISAALSFGDDRSAVLSFALTHRCCRSREAAARSWAWLSVGLAAGNESSCGSRFIGFFFGCDDAGGLRPLGFERQTTTGP